MSSSNAWVCRLCFAPVRKPTAGTILPQPPQNHLFMNWRSLLWVLFRVASFLHALKAAHEMSLRNHCHHHCRHAVTCDLDFEDYSKYRQAVDAWRSQGVNVRLGGGTSIYAVKSCAHNYAWNCHQKQFPLSGDAKKGFMSGVHSASKGSLTTTIMSCNLISLPTFQQSPSQLQNIAMAKVEAGARYYLSPCIHPSESEETQPVCALLLNNFSRKWPWEDVPNL